MRTKSTQSYYPSSPHSRSLSWTSLPLRKTPPRTASRRSDCGDLRSVFLFLCSLRPILRDADCARTESNMEPSVITEGRYIYVHDVKKGPPEAIDVHHIMVSRSAGGSFIFCTYALLCAIIGLLIFALLQYTTSVFQVLMPDKPVASFLGSTTLAGFFLRQLLRKQVEKESVIILPAFGVQLETTYRRKTVRHFVPIGKILKPVLNECVTPVTCYWSLSLILRGEDELLLVFKKLYPPVTMLVPIWKNLCAAIDDEGCTGVHSDYGTR